MYTTGSIGQVYALDAKTGNELWTFDPQNDMRVNQRACCDEVNRGVAVWRDGILVTTAPDILFARNTKGAGAADEHG